MIKYLIKFSAKKQYAKDLSNGMLFMQPLSYFQNKEIGQGDPYEGNVFPGLMVSKNTHIPICCMYAVADEQIDKGKIKIPNQIIDDFYCRSGYATVIKYKSFQKWLTRIRTRGYELAAGCVKYKRIQVDDVVPLWTINDLKNVFIKHPYFAYQQEFRIAIHKRVKDEKPVRYWAKHNLKKISKIIPIEKCYHDKKYYYIEIE